MKTLLILRHAKSSWKDVSLSDFERPLNDRGRNAAPLVGGLIKEKRIKPDLVLCSPAERARETAALVLKSSKIECPLRYDQRIYEAGVSDLLEVISQVGVESRTLLIVGHNPGLDGLLERLTGDGRHMSTAALAQVSIDIEEWGSILDHTGHLDWIVKPRELPLGQGN
jgi:phosphohistidine phosphatase